MSATLTPKQGAVHRKKPSFYPALTRIKADGLATADRPDIGNPNAPHNSRAVIVATGTRSTGYQNPDTKTCVTPNDVFVVQGTGFPNAKTIGRNTERSKWTENFDLNVFKNFRITERFKLEYRLEAFNVFNIPSSLLRTGTTALLKAAIHPKRV